MHLRVEIDDKFQERIPRLLVSSERLADRRQRRAIERLKSIIA
jgi:hypothetical protein